MIIDWQRNRVERRLLHFDCYRAYSSFCFFILGLS